MQRPDLTDLALQESVIRYRFETLDGNGLAHVHEALPEATCLHEIDEANIKKLNLA